MQRNRAFSRSKSFAKCRQISLLLTSHIIRRHLQYRRSGRARASALTEANAVHRQTVVRARPGSLRGNHRLSSTFTHGMPFIHDGAFGQRCDVRPRDIRESPLPCHPQVQTPLKHPNLLLQQSRVKRISNCYMRWSLALVVQSAPLHVTRTHKHAGSCVLVHDCASMRHPSVQV